MSLLLAGRVKIPPTHGLETNIGVRKKESEGAVFHSQKVNSPV